jgi:proline iminopeptidase
MPGLFPRSEPHESGLLDVGEGQHIYWEVWGNPSGKPAVVLHGGPGSGCSNDSGRVFDPAVYRIVLFDQRGAGRGRPRVGPYTDMSSNTTGDLVSDIEMLRAFLGIERWVVRGMSWGVTLGLVYAETYPERVVAMVLSSVTMTRPKDIHWLYHEVGRHYPEAWHRFREGVPEDGRDDLVKAYHQLLHAQPELAIRERAARDWCAWEDAVAPLPGGASNPRYDDPAFRMTFARIVTHYFHHRAWLGEDQILNEAHRLCGIPAVLIHGHLDLGGPVDIAGELDGVWPDAELKVVETGHTGGDPMTAATVEAAKRFAVLT